MRRVEGDLGADCSDWEERVVAGVEIDPASSRRGWALLTAASWTGSAPDATMARMECDWCGAETKKLFWVRITAGKLVSRDKTVCEECSAHFEPIGDGEGFEVP
jgi:hypothetical protein